MTKPSDPHFKLKIVAGLHKDAELLIDPEMHYTIGASDDCDIVLLDSGVADQHLTLCRTQEHVTIETAGSDVYIDGQTLPQTPYPIPEFAVVTLGEAHFAIGPADACWPKLLAPVIAKEAPCAPSMDLVPLYREDFFPGAIKGPGKLQLFFQDLVQQLLAYKWVQTAIQWIARTDKRLLIAISAFTVAFLVFVIDTWRYTPPPLVTMAYGKAELTQEEKSASKEEKKSALLSIVDGINNVRENTMVGTGLSEPAIPTEPAKAEPHMEPVDHIRKVLRSTWGQNLTEQSIDSDLIRFKGFDEKQRQDLVLNMERNLSGEVSAHAVTLTPRKKKAILSQLGDLIRVKVDAAEDMENVCQRVLEKKGVRQASAQFDIEDQSFTLEGKSNNDSTIKTARDIVAKVFPNFKIKSHIQSVPFNPGEIKINAVSTNGIPFVTLKNGTKVFKGGRLDNGCTLDSIARDHIVIECKGEKKKHLF